MSIADLNLLKARGVSDRALRELDREQGVPVALYSHLLAYQSNNIPGHNALGNTVVFSFLGNKYVPDILAATRTASAKRLKFALQGRNVLTCIDPSLS